jgi:hypothetical protein
MYRSRLAFALAMTALAAILIPSTLTAQITFQRTYGGSSHDGGRSVQQTSDGGYIIAGTTNSFGAGGSDVYLIKTDAHADTLWTRTFGGEAFDEGYSVQQTTDGGYVVAGWYDSRTAGREVYVIRTDTCGDTLWTRTYGGLWNDGGYSVQQTADGGYVVAGYTESFGAGQGDVYLIRTDANGDALWTRTFGGIHPDVGYSVLQTADSGYIVGGCTAPSVQNYSDVYLVKVDANGGTLWERAYGGEDEDVGYCVQQTTDGGYVVAGYTNSFGGSYWHDVYLVRTNAHGDTLWTRTFGGTSFDQGYSVQQTTDGGYITVGGTSSFGVGGTAAYLIKTDADGDTLWTRTYGGDDDDVGYAVQQTSDGGFIIAGVTESYGAGSADVYLIKTDSLGNVAVAEPKGSPTHAPALSLSCEPNPCRGATTIRFAPLASRHSPLVLRIYDAQGRAVRSFSSLLSPPSSLVWDGCDDMGQMLPSGAYFVRLDAGAQHASARIILQR